MTNQNLGTQLKIRPISNSPCPLDMLEIYISAWISTNFETNPIETRRENEVSVKCGYERVFGDFSPHKVRFLEFGESDWPWRWRVGFLGHQPHFLRAGLASDKV